MYAITGISGRVGGTLARTLLANGQRVRAVLRDPRKGEKWAALGCEIAVAAMHDASALTAAFTGATAAFVLPPPFFDPAPGYAEMRRVVDAVAAALRRAGPDRVLCLSTIGAQSKQDNLLTQLSMVEAALSALPMPVTFLRPGWYLENAAWDLPSARESRLIQSFLVPLEKPVPMVSTGDVGRVAAELIQSEKPERAIVELEGPRRVSPNDLAAEFARALSSTVRAVAVPRNTWEALFRSQGMKNPVPRMRMLDGFNDGWIDFAGTATNTIKGRIDVREVVDALVNGSEEDR